VTIISKKQLCQAFDPIMIFPEKTMGIINNPMKVSTSCVAPAYVLLEGSRGSRYLCDYHYQYEKDMTVNRTPELWPEIEKNIIDEREEVKKTFEKNVKTTETLNKLCWCKKDAYVKIIKKSTIGYGSMQDVGFFCNFHFRKFYYRNYSNGVKCEDNWKIVDERSRLNLSIIEEANLISLI
jgi:hypothetical protein